MLNMASVGIVSQPKSQRSMTWVLKIIFEIIFNWKKYQRTAAKKLHNSNEAVQLAWH